ncbi:MAG: hypothetical protein ABWZ53_10100, partial [Actinomycetota bacterium]
MRLRSAALVVASVAAACTEAGGGGRATSTQPTAPSPVVTSPSAAQGVDVDAFETRWPIKRVVF